MGSHDATRRARGRWPAGSGRTVTTGIAPARSRGTGDPPALAIAIGSLIMGVILLSAPVAASDQDGFIVGDDGAFLSLLDLSRPELAEVKEALQQGDVARARTAYIAHFRARRFDPALITDWESRARNAGHSTSGADNILAGHMWDGYSVYEVPETGLDWQDSPLSCVTRFPVLGTLRAAIHHTRDARYTRWAVDHILGYMAAYPIEQFVGQASTSGWTSHTVVARPWYWCMIPERIHEMVETIALVRGFSEVGDEELLSMLRRLYEELGYLRGEIQAWVDRRHNGGCAMLQSMAEGCELLGDFPQSRAWLEFDALLFRQYVQDAFYPDGMCVELTVAYSAETSVVQQRLAYALRNTEAVARQKGRLQAMVTCMAALSDPTGWLPSFGDLYAGELPRYVHLPLVRWLEMPWVEPLVTQSPGPPPPFTTWPAPGEDQWCGYYTMRSGWEKRANYMAIDGGPWGTTHQHGDKLSFVVTAKGAKFIIDPSSTRYASNEPDAFIGGQPSGFLHNTITVDGVDEFMSEGGTNEAEEPLSNRWEQGDGYVLFVGDYSFRPVKNVHWQRRVLFVDGAYWLLQDVMVGEPAEVAVEQNLQFEADVEVRFDGSGIVATAPPDGARLLVVPLEGQLAPELTVGDREPHVSYWPGGKPDHVLRREDGHDQKHGRGWTGRSGSRLIAAPAVTYRGDATLPATITLLLIPQEPGGGVLPQVLRDVTSQGSLWTLPRVSGGAVHLRTSPSEFAVIS